MIPVGANLISGEFNIQQRVERWKELNITRTSETKGYDKKKALSRAGLEPALSRCMAQIEPGGGVPKRVNLGCRS